MLLDVIKIWQSHETKPSVILHSCCAPCEYIYSWIYVSVCRYYDSIYQILIFILNMSIEKKYGAKKIHRKI